MVVSFTHHYSVFETLILKAREKLSYFEKTIWSIIGGCLGKATPVHRFSNHRWAFSIHHNQNNCRSAYSCQGYPKGR